MDEEKGELTYDLLLSPEHNVPESPGYEGFGLRDFK